MRLEWIKKWGHFISGGSDMMVITFFILQYYIFANKEKNIENEHSPCEGEKINFLGTLQN
jgi:hypothetical protein